MRALTFFLLPCPHNRRRVAEVAGKLYQYRKGIIIHARQPVRMKRSGEARWVVFFIGGPEKDRKFTIEVSPEGKATKFIEGI